MIDVVFLLLVFFMVATTVLDPEREIDLDLPLAETGRAVEQQPEELVIDVHEDGQLRLAGREVEATELDRALEHAALRDPATPVTIRGDKLTRHQSIVSVLDACGRAGLGNLSVGTRSGS
jgi:biopolymer transport protein ExbD